MQGLRMLGAQAPIPTVHKTSNPLLRRHCCCCCCCCCSISGNCRDRGDGSSVDQTDSCTQCRVPRCHHSFDTSNQSVLSWEAAAISFAATSSGSAPTSSS